MPRRSSGSASSPAQRPRKPGSGPSTASSPGSPRRSAGRSAEAAPQTVSGDVEADWTAIAEYVALVENTADEAGKLVLPNHASRSVDNLRARLGHVRPAEIDTDAAIAALRILPPDKTTSYRDSIRFFNKLIATRARHAPIAHLLPAAPVGHLPTLRDRPMDWSLCTEAFRADLAQVIERAIRVPRQRDRFGGRLGRDPVAERRRATKGRKRPVRNKSSGPRRSARRSPGSPGTPFPTGRRSTRYDAVEELADQGQRLGGRRPVHGARAGRGHAQGSRTPPPRFRPISTISGRSPGATARTKDLLWEIEDLRLDYDDGVRRRAGDVRDARSLREARRSRPGGGRARSSPARACCSRRPAGCWRARRSPSTSGPRRCISGWPRRCWPSSSRARSGHATSTRCSPRVTRRSSSRRGGSGPRPGSTSPAAG